MIIQIDTYKPKIIEFARTYLDYYHNDWKSVPIHRLASLDFRRKINEGKLDSTPLGIDFDGEIYPQEKIVLKFNVASGINVIEYVELLPSISGEPYAP
jgi:hypothetical protein